MHLWLLFSLNKNSQFWLGLISWLKREVIIAHFGLFLQFYKELTEINIIVW